MSRNATEGKEGTVWNTATAPQPTSTDTLIAGFRSCINQAGVGTSGFIGPNYTRVGWTLGYGTAFDLGHNWSAKAEYDFMSFGNHTALQNDGSTVLTDKSWVSQVKVGVDYKFTAGPAVIAKY